MAIIKDKNDIPRADLPIPAAHYPVAILKVDTNPAKSGADMITLTLQILSPDDVVADGKRVKIAGRTFRHYIVFSDANLGRAIKSAEILLGQELPSSFDTKDVGPAVAEALAGKYFPSLELTPDEIFVTDNNYQPILGPDGQKQHKGWGIKLKGDVAPAAVKIG